MKIIKMEANPGGGYPSPQDWHSAQLPEGFASVADSLDLAAFYQAKGFILPSFEDQVLTSYTVNQEALDAWNAEHPEPDPLVAAKEAKLAELSAACKAAIENGLDITLADGSTAHFDYTIEDQSNIGSMWNAVTAGAACYPYHAKDDDCAVYSAADIITIYTSLAGLQTAQTTYHNQLKAMLRSAETVEAVESIVYGQELAGKYLETYNEMLQVAQEQMAAILARISAQVEAAGE